MATELRKSGRIKRNRLLAGITASLAGVGMLVVAGDNTEPILDCEQIDTTLICTEVVASGGTTTSSTLGTTTTTAADGDPYATVASNFDATESGPWINSGYFGLPSDSSSEPTGNFRVICELKDSTQFKYVDPILAPGNASFMHLHMFWGNDSVTENSTYKSLRETGGGTCAGGPVNRTAYWMPALFNGNTNRQVVTPDLFIVYYKAEQSQGLTLEQAHAEFRTMVEYPNGFRYLGGQNPAGTKYTFFEWKCEGGSGAGTTIPDSCPAGEKLIASIAFPHCWDGVNLWLPNNAHVAQGGPNHDNRYLPCEPPFDSYIPSLTEFAHFPSSTDMSNWYLSSDRMSSDPANWWADGASLHADWFGAWDNPIQSSWIENCLRDMWNSTNDLCQTNTHLSYPPNYTGPTYIDGFTPMHPTFGDGGWPIGQGP